MSKQTHSLFFCFLYKIIYYICKQSYNIYGKSNQQNKRGACRKRDKADMACRETRQEFYDSELIRLQSPPAQSGTVIPNSRDITGQSKGFDQYER